METHAHTAEEATDETTNVDVAGADAPVTGGAQDLEVQLQQARDEARENYDRYLRVHAEMENYKKRIERTYADLARSAKKDLLLKLLGVKDNLERALTYGSTTSEGSDESVVQGVRLTEYQLDQVLRGEGVTPMELRGQPYDPELAEAIGTVVNPELSEHSVAEVVQQGYTYQDAVLRPAKVIVAVAAEGDQL